MRREGVMQGSKSETAFEPAIKSNAGFSKHFSPIVIYETICTFKKKEDFF